MTAVFQSFWHGPPLGRLRHSCLESFLRHGHRFQLYTYGRVDVPDGVELLDADAIIPEDELFYFRNAELAEGDLGPFSDLFRFRLLLLRGGWWSDVDTICLSPDIPEVERAWGRELPEVHPRAVGTSQIAFGAGDPVVAELYRRCLELSIKGFKRREALGPNLISKTIADMDLPPDMWGSTKLFYPLRWIEMFKLWLPEFCSEVEEKSRGSLFLPIYQSFPQYIGLAFEALPPEGSYLGAHCDRACASGDTDRFSVRQIRDGTRRFMLKHAWALEELVAVCGEDVLTPLDLEPPQRQTT